MEELLASWFASQNCCASAQSPQSGQARVFRETTSVSESFRSAREAQTKRFVSHSLWSCPRRVSKSHSFILTLNALFCVGQGALLFDSHDYVGICSNMFTGCNKYWISICFCFCFWCCCECMLQERDAEECLLGRCGWGSQLQQQLLQDRRFRRPLCRLKTARSFKESGLICLNYFLILESFEIWNHIESFRHPALALRVSPPRPRTWDGSLCWAVPGSPWSDNF